LKNRKNPKNMLTKKTFTCLEKQVLDKAFKFHSQGNISEAAKHYKFFIDKGFHDHRVFSNYGVILKDLGKLKEAEISTRKAIELKPNFANAYLNLGNILKDLGKLKEAEISTRKAIELQTDFANAYSNLGSILKELGELKEAEISLEKAIELQPNFADAYLNLGGVLSDLGKSKEAEVFARKAIQLNPNNPLAHLNLVSILRDLGKSKDAENSSKKAIQLNPSNPFAHLSMGSILKDLENFKEAEISFRKAIELKPDFADAYSNLGSIYTELSKLKEAEISFRKAIELKPDFAIAHSNLGGILRDLGKLEEAEISLYNAFRIDPNLTTTIHILSTLKKSNNQNNWKEYLFSSKILNNQSKKDLVNIYFARANVLHKQKDYEGSSISLKLANELKYKINPSTTIDLIKQSKQLLVKSKKYKDKYIPSVDNNQKIFIVGMPRSGSTLVESIISMNSTVHDLGEINIFEESFLDWEKYILTNRKSSLNELYDKKIAKITGSRRITTNKWLYNYQYAGIIASQLTNAKIIHCYRNPLDNILSIYRSNFAKGNSYSSSLVECMKVYLDQDDVMTEYKHMFRSEIYDLNYDLLATNPDKEIKSLIYWLGWQWENYYLSPHLNPRSISTASNIEVRHPINSKSVSGWRNYKKMLKPAMDLISSTQKYGHLIN